MLASVKRVYQLHDYTAESRAEGWFFWESYGDKTDIKGPVSGITSVTLMIARSLKREINKRDAVHTLPE